ncbi:MAG: hypothetical protein KF729_24495 [Sandaracinaceae bacterium]|nr:hypothetical protein [Sandaracinaceae bacterium]
MTDLSVEILKQIPDELKQTHARLEQTNARLDQTNDRLGRLEQRQTATELRLSTELVAVVSAVHELRDVILEDRKLRATVDDHEHRIRALERHTG